MDHRHYNYSALPQRVAQPWHADNWLAAYVVLFLEHWELVPPDGALRDPRLVGEFGSFSPDYRSWTQREYGLRIGVFRIVEALKDAGVRPCIAANAMAAERLPELVELFNNWGCEWVGHGMAATRIMHSRMSKGEQLAHINESMQVLERITGQRPRGWMSQDWGTSPDTFDLLVEAGVSYTLDLPNDEQPYWLRTEPALLAIPYSAELDDVQCQWLRFVEPHIHAELTCGALDRIVRDCHSQCRPAVFSLGVHPWLSGIPSRISAFRDMLAGLRSAPGVWWTSPGVLNQEIRRRQT